MAKGYAITIGVDDYSQWITAGDLPSCVNDARFMNSLAKAFSYSELYSFVNRDATMRNVIEGIISVASRAVAGDIVIIYYSGHGTVVPDTKTRANNPGENGDEIPDLLYQGKFDSGYCLYDNVILYDDFFTLLMKLFAKDVRVYVISDCCYSFSMVDEVSSVVVNTALINSGMDHISNSKLKSSFDKIFPTFGAKRKQELLNLLKTANKKGIEASVIEFSSSSNMTTSLAGSQLSVFTNSIYDNIFQTLGLDDYPVTRLKAHCTNDLYRYFRNLYNNNPGAEVEDIRDLIELGLDNNIHRLSPEDQISTLISYKLPRLQYRGKFSRNFQNQEVFKI
jgi:hypothetical protein